MPEWFEYILWCCAATIVGTLTICAMAGLFAVTCETIPGLMKSWLKRRENDDGTRPE